MKPCVIFWFRRDLRLNDNHGLFQALCTGMEVLPVFIFDTDILDELDDKADKRVAFIHYHLTKINEKLKEYSSSLLVLHNTPLQAFTELVTEYSVHAVYTNTDYEPYATERDKKIESFLRARGIEFHSFKDQVIFERSEVMKQDGKPYTVYTPYAEVWVSRLAEKSVQSYLSEEHLGKCVKMDQPFPSLESIGFETIHPVLSDPAIDEDIIRNYDLTRNQPSKPTSRLGVHLRFGTISIRKVVAVAYRLNRTFLKELIWREFFMMILYHFPHVVTDNFKPEYDYLKWRNNEDEFRKWCRGITGYPIVDAGMREMNETGFMHNRLRMITAGFLVKHLLVDWRWGESYFAKKLLDYELASNNGNWQWVAGTGCDAVPYFRIFNPELQQKKFDPDNIYIDQWLDSSYNLEPMVDHKEARERALQVYKKARVSVKKY